MFIILIINSRLGLTGVTCSPPLHGYITAGLPVKEQRMELIWALSGTDSALTSRLVRWSRRSAAERRPKTWLKCAATGRTRAWRQEAHPFKTRRGREDGREDVDCFERIPGCRLPPEGLGFTARNGTPSRSNVLSRSLQETAHHGPGLGEFHTSQGYSVLGSTLALPRGEINTPAGPRKCVRAPVCACVLASLRACTRECVYTQLCFFNDTYSHIPSPKKTG